MKRNFELIKKILLKFEELPLNHNENEIIVDEFSKNEVTYHVFLLAEANLVEIQDASSFDGKDFLPERLTWEGHEFLDNIRNDSIWNGIKSFIASKGGDIGFSVLKALAEAKAKEYFGLNS